MTRVGIYDQIKAAIQDLVAPALHEIRGEMQAMRADIRRLDQKIDGVDEKIDNVVRRVDTRIDGVDRELRTAIDIRERLAALEARRP